MKISTKSICSETQCRDYLSQISGGSESALDKLYPILSRPIFLFAMSYCRQKETAEDIVQDTFVKIICNIEQYQKRGYAKTWIFTITKNLCLDYAILRQEPPYCVDIPVEMDCSIIELTDTIECISKTEQQVICLHVLAGLKQKEVAEVLSLPLNKVRYIERSARKN